MMSTRPGFLLLLLVLLAVLLWHPVELVAQRPPAVSGETPLERHRRDSRRGTQRPEVHARITSATQGVIVTDISSQTLALAGIEEQEIVEIRFMGQRLLARVLERSTYRDLLADEAGVESLDVDVVALVDRVSPLTILGVSGDLAAWLRPRPGTPVAIRKR